MKTSITKGLTKEDADEVKGEFISSFHLRQQMIRLLEEKIQSTQAAMRDLERYKDASWPYYQADRQGQIRAYEEIISLFS